MMKCPKCGDMDRRVLDCRPTKNVVRRRSRCVGCNLLYTTYEHVALPEELNPRNRPRDRYPDSEGIKERPEYWTQYEVEPEDEEPNWEHERYDEDGILIASTPAKEKRYA